MKKENKKETKKIRTTLSFKNIALGEIVRDLTPTEKSLLFETSLYHLLASQSGRLLLQTLSPSANIDKIIQKISLSKITQENQQFSHEKKDENIKKDSKNEEKKIEQKNIKKEPQEISSFFKKQTEIFN
jgi:hypothetical protein